MEKVLESREFCQSGKVGTMLNHVAFQFVYYRTWNLQL